MLDWFSTSLQGPALIWYHSLERSKKASWVELSKAFLDHFSFNTTLNVGLRELETTVQKRDEPFVDYLTRWRKRLILIKNRPEESELIEMFIKGTLPEFRSKLYFIPLKDFGEVYKMGIRIENQLNEERRANVRTGFSGNRSGGMVNKPVGTSGTGNTKASGSQNVNVVRNFTERRFSKFSLPLSKILERCIKRGLLQPLEPRPLPDPLPPRFNLRAFCNFHQSKGHDTNSCKRLRHEIQDLIDSGKIPDPEEVKPSTTKNPLPDFSPNGVYVVGNYKSEEEVIANIEQEEMLEEVENLVVKEIMASSIWDSDNDDDKGELDYEAQVEIAKALSKTSKDEELIVDDEQSVGNLTRSGRVFKPTDLRTGENSNKRSLDVEKEKEAEKWGVEKKKDDCPGGTDAESVLKQLKRTRADVTIWDLILASKSHREALLKALATCRVPTEVTTDELVAFIQKPQSEIVFSEKDLTPEGRNHVKPLFIQAEINGRLTGNVMVDDGSALNVCPLKLLPKFKIDVSELKPSSVVIRAYDNTRRGVEGTFVANVKVGQIESLVEITVLDIPATFAVLLGRPWFHPLGGVPSTLHRKIKFPFGNEVITINAQPEAGIALLNEDEIELPMNGFQVAVLRVDNVGEQIMKKYGYKRGCGLGKYGQGIVEPVSTYQMLERRAGLGYNGGKKALNDIQEPKFEKGLKRLFFTPAAYDDFEVDGKMYPGLKVFMTDFEEMIVENTGDVENFAHEVDGLDEHLGLAPALEEMMKKFEDLLGIGGQDQNKAVQKEESEEGEANPETAQKRKAGEAEAVIEEEQKVKEDSPEAEEEAGQ